MAIAAEIARFGERMEARRGGRCASLVREASPLLRRLAADDRAVARIAANAKGHPEKRMQIVLASSATHSVRLHVWARSGAGTGADTGAVEEIHNHRWPFTSLILCGGLEYEEFRLAGRGIPLYRAHCSGTFAQGWDFETPELVHLGRSRHGVRTAGTLYRMKPAQLHRTWPTRDFTATIIVYPRAVKPFADLFTPRPMPMRLDYDAPMKELETVRRTIANVAEACC